MSTIKTIVNSTFLVIFAIMEILCILASMGHGLSGDWGSFFVTVIMGVVFYALVKVFKSNIDKA